MATDLIRNMTGAALAGLVAAVFGWPGLIFGLALAFAYYQRAR